LLKQPVKETQSVYIKDPRICLTDALNIYLNYKGKGRNKAFHKAAERACRYLIEATSLKKIDDYTRQDALDFRDFLITRGLVGSSITRVFNIC
jgi:hypothetical protein